MSWCSPRCSVKKMADVEIRDEHFYHVGLRQFGAFDRLKLDPAPLLQDLLHVAAEDESGIAENGLIVDDVVEVSYRFPSLNTIG